MTNFKRVVSLVVLFATPMVIAQDAVFEELTVTAQKRTSTVMDTAAAIAAISGDDLQERGIRNITDLDQLSPDLVIGGEGVQRKQIRIRGVGTYSFDVAADPSVAIVIDGVPQPRATTNMSSFTDLERIEILKGPQGAIYGVNSIGGIVNIVTKKPTGGQAGRVVLNKGDNGQEGLSFTYENDLNNSVSGRFHLSSSQEDGTAFDEVTGLDNGADQQSMRASFYGSTNSGIDWTASISHNKTNADAQVMEQKFICNSTNAQTHWLPVFSAGPTNPANVCTSLADSASQNTYGVTNLENALVKAAYASENSQALSTPGYAFMEDMTASFNMSKDFSNYRVTGILGVTKVNSGELRDFDATSANALTQGHNASTDTATVEVRIDSDDSVKYPWSIGLYALRDDGYREDEFTSFPQSVQNILFGFAASANATGNMPPNPAQFGTVLSAMQACVATPNSCAAFYQPGVPRVTSSANGGAALAAATGGEFVTATDLANLQLAMTGKYQNFAKMGIKTSSQAVFGNVKIPLTQDLELFVGGRYSIHDKPYTYSGRTNATNVPLVIVDYETNGGLTTKEFDPKVTLEYTQGDALSWITYSTAYKSGGPRFAQWVKATAEITYAQEELEMIEVGYKTDLNGGSSQLELTAYNYDYTDNQQLLVCVQDGSPGGCVVTGDATIQGLDLTYRTYLSDKTSIGGTYAFVDATWDRFCDTAAAEATLANPCGIDRKGQTLPFSAENNLSMNIQHIENMDMGELTLTASVSYKDEYSVTLGKWDGLTTVTDLTKLNLSAELASPNGWNLNLVCTNCTDEIYQANGLMGVRAQGGGYRYANAEGRRIGLSLETNF